MNLSGNLLALIIAAGAGLTMALQGASNAALGRAIGLWETNLVVHIIGTIILLVAVFLLKIGDGNLSLLGSAPWYGYLGGFLSVLIIYGVARSIPKVGAANATTAIIVGQILTAAALDHFGLFGLKKTSFSWICLLGVGLMAAGAWILLRR